MTEDEADQARDDELFAELIGRLHAEGKLPDDPRELAARIHMKPPRPLTHHVITVSRVIRGYREKLHRFGALDEAPPARWIYVPAPSKKAEAGVDPSARQGGGLAAACAAGVHRSDGLAGGPGGRIPMYCAAPESSR